MIDIIVNMCRDSLELILKYLTSANVAIIIEQIKQLIEEIIGSFPQ